MITNNECYILALIKRDDGERLLLGSGYYEFTAGQKHFNPNQFANDVVELQGTDGQLLAGQVRRSTSQVFEGIIGDGTTSKEIVEQKRREFFLFFRKQHHYTVVYIMPDGTAIKRDRGYITDAPAVQELYQFQPKWRIALAFEDVNYYSYAEDAQGNEIYSFEATLALANIADGGLVWDVNGSKSDARTYTGKNIFDAKNAQILDDYYITASGPVQNSAGFHIIWVPCEPNTTYTIQWGIITPSSQQRCRIGTSSAPITEDSVLSVLYAGANAQYHSPRTITTDASAKFIALDIVGSGTTTPMEQILSGIQIEKGQEATAYEQFEPGSTTGGYIFAPSTGGGPVVVTVNGVDKASPVWHVYGPATNPILTNSTTGEALTWNGTVPANQELIIDMGAQTATLEGANVFEYVSGSWVHLEPGANRISYSAGNTTRSSKVFWNEVVG